MTKRKRGNNQKPHLPAVQGLPPPLPIDEKLVEQMVREVLEEDYGLKLVNRISRNEHQIGVKVDYKHVAPHVGLQPTYMLRDINTFPLRHSRIPTTLFKFIVEDINLLLVQYGPPDEHDTEEATSRLLSPIFNRLVAEFGGSVRNCPATNIKGPITTGGRIDYNFVAFGSVSILCVKSKLRIASLDDRLDAVAQVIAECEGCHDTNKIGGFSVPVHCILFDGECFQFFLFEGHATPPFSFKCGTIAGKRSWPFRFPISNFMTVETCHLLFEKLRPICEITFDLLLLSYVSGLNAYSVKERKRTRPWTTRLEKALILARFAQEKFRDADLEHQNRDQSSATTSVTDAMNVFRLSIELIPKFFTTKSMLDFWNDEAVEEI